MKLIHLISGGDVGGAKTHVLSLLQGLNRTEDVHLICFMEGPFAEEARCLGIPTTVIEGSNPMAVRKRILAIIRHDDCQLLHCHGARANMIGALVQRQARIPVISTIHSDYRLDYLGRPLAALTYGNINKVALRRFDAWIGVSDGMRQLLISRGFDPQRIFPLYNGVDFSTPLKTVPRDEWLRGIGPVENGLAGKAGEKLPGGDAIFASVGAEPALAAVYTVQLIMLLDTGPPGVCCGAFLRPVIEQLQITVMAAAGTFIQLFSMEFRCKRSPRFDCALSWNIPRIIIENMHVIFKIFFVSGFPGAANGDFAQ